MYTLYTESAIYPHAPSYVALLCRIRVWEWVGRVALAASSIVEGAVRYPSQNALGEGGGSGGVRSPRMTVDGGRGISNRESKRQYGKDRLAEGPGGQPESDDAGNPKDGDS